MGMFDAISFSPPDFNMGDDGGELLNRFLRRKDHSQVRAEQQRRLEQFQSSLPNLRKRQEMDNVSRVMNPQAQETKAPNVKFAPYNPGLDEFRRNQTELGRDKLNLAREKQENQANLANRNMSVKERLAGLKDMSDSEKAKLLQEGKVTLQEIRDSEAMKRLEVTGQQRTEQIAQQGDIRSGQIDKQNEGAMNRVVKQGEIGSSYITKRGEQARETKAAPSSTPPSSSQQGVALRNKAVQLVNQNPAIAQFITFNEQGSPIISPDAPMEAQMEIYRSLYGTSATTPVGAGQDVNLPAGQPQSPQQQAPPQPNVPGVPTNKFGVLQKTGMFKPGMEEPPAQTPMPSAPGNNSFVTMITPDGKGTRIVPKNQIQTAITQGYKPQGGGK